MYLCYSLLADLRENYDSLPAKINNKIVQQYEQSEQLQTSIVDKTVMCTEKIEGRQSQSDN